MISLSSKFSLLFVLSYVIYLSIQFSACEFKDKDNQTRRVQVVKTDTSYVTRGRIIGSIDTLYYYDTIMIKDYTALMGTNQFKAVLGDKKDKPITKSNSLQLKKFVVEKNKIYSHFPGFNLETIYEKPVQIQNSKILIPISKNVLMIYESNQNPVNSNEYSKYTYIGYFPCIESHILKCVVEDATYYILLNHKDGSEYTFNNLPKISPNCNYFCIEDETTENNEGKGTVLNIYSLSKTKEGLVISNVLDTFLNGYFNLKAYWQNDKIISLEYTRTSSDWEENYNSYYELSDKKKVFKSKAIKIKEAI